MLRLQAKVFDGRTDKRADNEKTISFDEGA